MKPAKLIAIGAAAITVGWIATKILGHTGTFIGWLFDPVFWGLHLLRWLLAPLGWALGWFPLSMIHVFWTALLAVGVALIVGRATVLGLRAGDRQLRRAKHRAVKDNIALLESRMLAEKTNAPER